MERKQALEILGLKENASWEQIRKKYREKIRQVHPDAKIAEVLSGEKKEKDLLLFSHRYSQNINEAYSVLRKMKKENGLSEKGRTDVSESREKKTANVWDAPINPYAYTEREVYQYVYDPDGEILGTFVVGKGAYYWVEEEELGLFLMSVRDRAMILLEQIDEQLDREAVYQKRTAWINELAYLLAQNYVDSVQMLNEILPEKEGIYAVPVMVELIDPGKRQNFGEVLLPKGMKDHRLYVRNRNGDEIGYLSFVDDRMYQIVIPILEQRRAQVKICVSEKQEQKITGRRRKTAQWQGAVLYLKMKQEQSEVFSPEAIRDRIREFLKQYEHALT